MNLKIFPLFFLGFAPPAGAIEQTPLKIQKAGNPNLFKLQWDSLAGRSYFLQQSTDLTTWNYFPEVMAGLGGLDWMGVASNGNKGFFRLIATNVPATDIYTVDHDGDGIPSFAELTITHTDPLQYSTQGNGVSDRGSFPLQPNGVLTDFDNGVQYVVLPNAPGVTTPPAIVAYRYFAAPNYIIEATSATMVLPKVGYKEYTSPTTVPNSKVRYLNRRREMGIRSWTTGQNVPAPWDFGYTWNSSLPVHKVTLYNSSDYDVTSINPVTCAETITPSPSGRTGNLATHINRPDSYAGWGWKFPSYRGMWAARFQNNDFYMVPPFTTWSGHADPWYEEYYYNENTVSKLFATALANRPAYTVPWAEGSPLAFWDFWTDEMGISYSRSKFRIKNINGLPSGEPAEVFVYFQPEGSSFREEVMHVTWNGQGIYSPDYEIDPANLRPGVQGTFLINTVSTYFELDVGQSTNRKEGKTVVIPMGQDDEGSGPSLAERGMNVTSNPSAPLIPGIKFPGMDDSWYDGASITLSKISGSGAVRFTGVDPYTGYETTVPFGQNLAPYFFHSRGPFAAYDWKIEGTDVGPVTLRLTYTKGTTTLTIDRVGLVAPNVKLTPQSIPLTGLIRSKVRLANLGATPIPILSPNQMPLISVGGTASTDVKQDELDPTTFYFTPPILSSTGPKEVKISGISLGGFTFTPTGTTLDSIEDLAYTDNLLEGIASFSNSIGVSISEALSMSIIAKNGGLSTEAAVDFYMAKMSSVANEEMALVKSFVANKPFPTEAENAFDLLVNESHSKSEVALEAIYGGVIPAAVSDPIPISTANVTPLLGNAAFFPTVR